MKKGYLSDYFSGIAAKKLSSVEANPIVSNQHEFNGVTQLKELFGYDRITVDATFIYLSDEEDKRITFNGFLTWYDARENNPYRSEFRLYFPSNDVTNLAEPGDLLVIAKKNNGTYAVIIAPENSTYENQLIWLFGLSVHMVGFDRKNYDVNDKELSFASKFILDELGFEVEESDENYLDLIFGKFGDKYPTTKVFSEFARNTLPDIRAIDNPDVALIKWIEREEILFKTLEEYLVLKQINVGFDDVDSFISYSLSIHNRRKSRVGYALENHLMAIFDEFGLKFSNGAITENRSRPDFLFPNIAMNHKPGFPKSCLTMLGVKTTCKDRWRQVLSEAEKVNQKHLFTLEPKISENQTDEMRSHQLQLVLPNELHQTFTTSQQAYLLDLADFISMVQKRQSKCL